jgi:hypothetical protein
VRQRRQAAIDAVGRIAAHRSQSTQEPDARAPRSRSTPSRRKRSDDDDDDDDDADAAADDGIGRNIPNLGLRAWKTKHVNMRLCASAAIRAVAAAGMGLSRKKAAAVRRLVFAPSADDEEDGDDDDGDDVDDGGEDDDDNALDALDDDDDGDDGDGDGGGGGDADPQVAEAAAALRVMLKRYWPACPATGRVKLSAMPLPARWLLLKELQQRPDAARPKHRRRIAPHANAEAHALRLDVQSLRQAVGIAGTTSDADVFRAVLLDYDAVLSRLSRSSRSVKVLESLIVCGTCVTAAVRSQARAPAVRKRAHIVETKSLCDALAQVGDDGYSDWLCRCIEDNLRALFPRRSYMSAWVLGFWRDVRRKVGFDWCAEVKSLLDDIEKDNADDDDDDDADDADEDDDAEADDDDGDGGERRRGAAAVKEDKTKKKKKKKSVASAACRFRNGCSSTVWCGSARSAIYSSLSGVSL